VILEYQDFISVDLYVGPSEIFSLLAGNTQSSRGQHIVLKVGCWCSRELFVQPSYGIICFRYYETDRIKKNKDIWLSAVTTYIMLRRVRKVMLVTCHRTGRVEQPGNTWPSPLTKHHIKESRKRVPLSTVTKVTHQYRVTNPNRICRLSKMKIIEAARIVVRVVLRQDGLCTNTRVWRSDQSLLVKYCYDC